MLLAGLIALCSLAFGEDYHVSAPIDMGTAGSIAAAYGMQPTGAGEIRPIGWSRDGKFAFLRIVTPEFKGTSIYEYRVFDAMRDQVAFSLDDDVDSWTREEMTDQRGGVDVSWDRVGDQVSASLEELGIEQTESIELVRFPAPNGPERLGCYLTITTEEDPYDASPYGASPYPDNIASYAVTLTSDMRGEKRVTLQEEVYAVSAWVEGFLRSPFENRILVIVSEKMMGFEMTPSMSYRFYGSHLDVGFSK